MNDLTNKSLQPYATWENPTLQDVVNVFEKLGMDNKKFEQLLGLNERTYRRWTSKKTLDRLTKSPIPYGAWCVLVALSERKYIFSAVKKRDISQVPKNYICTFESFKSPPKEILILFVGKNSITGLQRTELARLFGWSSIHISNDFNKGKISFINWVLLLVFCGVNIKELINI
jgi:hypothetical protein